MSIPTRIKQYLDEQQVKYEALTHSRAFTAQEVAHSMHVHGRELAKAVIVKADGGVVMAVLPAHHKIDLNRFKAVIGAKEVELATEAEFKDRFPDCEVGAMPILGNLYDVPVYAAEPLAEDEEIVFNAGSHTDAVRIKFKDFVRLAQPRMANFSFVE